MFEGDFPDHRTFWHLFVLQENKRSFKLQKMYFWNRPRNSSQIRIGLQPAPAQPDCTQCTFKSLSAKSCVGVSSCSLRRSSEGSHSRSRAWFHSWWHPQMLQGLVPCCTLSEVLAHPANLPPNTAIPALEITSLANLWGATPDRVQSPWTRCKGILQSELNGPLPSRPAFRHTVLLLPLLSATLPFADTAAFCNAEAYPCWNGLWSSRWGLRKVSSQTRAACLSEAFYAAETKGSGGRYWFRRALLVAKRKGE